MHNVIVEYAVEVERHLTMTNYATSSFQGYLRLAKCYMMLGDLSAADKALLKVLEIEPSNPQLVPERANLAIVQKYSDDAEKCLEKQDFRTVVFLMDRVLEIVRGCQRFTLMKAESLALLGRHEEAQEIAKCVFFPVLFYFIYSTFRTL